MKYEAVIGLEVHVQLLTDSKIFCSCPTRPREGGSVGDERANVNTCPICAGHPGCLPVMNRKVVECAVLAGLATGSQIRQRSVFARKNYFYPDMPKNYQISQYEEPIAEQGFVEIPTSTGPRKIRLRRIHLEEDAGKNLHMFGYSLINLNRAGVPLIEMVSEPDLRSPEEAAAYLRALHGVVTFLGICKGDLQEGHFRCDANVSIREAGSTALGTRTELKNLNSYRFIEKALAYEIARQIEVVHAGGKIRQETRSYDPAKNVTVAMRSKEEEQDYRYFPEPDLLPLVIDSEWIEAIKKKMPELPDQKRKRWASQYRLSELDTSALTSTPEMSLYFEAVVSEFATLQGTDLESHVKTAANFLTTEITRLQNESAESLKDAKFTPSLLAELVRLTRNQTLSSTGAKQALEVAWKTGESIASIVERLGLKQVSDESAIDRAIEKIIAQNPGPVSEFLGGKEKVIGFLVGQVMKEMAGKANPPMIQERLKKLIQQKGASS